MNWLPAIAPVPVACIGRTSRTPLIAAGRAALAPPKDWVRQRHARALWRLQCQQQDQHAHARSRAGRPPTHGDGSRGLFEWMHGKVHPPVARVGAGAGSDPYAWLQHGDEREIKAYLEAENKYAKSVLKPAKKLERALFKAMSERVDDQEHGDPEKIERWYYYMRTSADSSFPIYCRKEKLERGVEEVLLDQDEMSSRLPYLMVPQCKISPCHTKLAYTADTSGNERYTGFIKDLRSGKIICEVPDVTTLEWATDGKTIFYTQPDHHRRPYRVWRRNVLGEACAELILEEPDAAFYMDAGLTKDKKWITISLNSKTASEVRIINAREPWSDPILVQPRSCMCHILNRMPCTAFLTCAQVPRDVYPLHPTHRHTHAVPIT